MPNRRQETAGQQVLDKTCEIGGSIKDIGAIVRQAVAERLSELGEDAKAYGRQGADKVLELRDDAAAIVERQPLRSVLIAAGAGLLVGFLMRRR